MHTKSVQLAHQIWPILIDLANVNSTIIYQELGERFGITGRALQNFDRILAPIKRYCEHNDLPPLSALVVRKDSGLPGTGAEADETDMEAVFAYNWRGRRPLIPSEDEFAAVMTSN